MSLQDRILLEKKQLDPTTFHQKNCFNCKFWMHKVKQDYRNCHKCINNTRIALNEESYGYDVVGLRDYFSPSKNTDTDNKKG